jgi:hypothetical protein
MADVNKTMNEYIRRRAGRSAMPDDTGTESSTHTAKRVSTDAGAGGKGNPVERSFNDFLREQAGYPPSEWFGS